MKDSLLMQAMNRLDGEYIAEAAPTAAAPMKRIRRRLAMKWTSVAAGFCAALLLVWQVVIPYVRDPALPDAPSVNLPHDYPVTFPDAPSVNLPDTPIYDHALYTAEDIGNQFDKTYDSLGTSSYTKIYVPDERYLRVTEIPEDEYISVYKRNTDGKPLDTKEFTAFADQMLDSVSSALGITRLGYTVNQREAFSYSSTYLEAVFNAAEEREIGYNFLLSQYGMYNTFHLYGNSSSDGQISLNGVPVKIDQSKTDDEIIASLGDIKTQLFSVFGVTFEDVKIIRRYDSYSEHGATSLSVYFYNAADEPLNEYIGPVSDYICLYFDNISNWSGDVVSDTVLSNVDIDYFQYRTDDTYTVSQNVRMISLEEAEWLLYNGYVFGGHSCPICMSMQSEVDFEGYDLVGLAYVFGYDSHEGIPFYTFYKKIGTAPNGNSIYAMTYVPAVEVNGYKEYFEKQQEQH